MSAEEKKKASQHYAVKSFGGELAVKDIDPTARIVTGFFSTFNVVDSDSDILVSGCAKKSIKERGADSNAVAKIKHCLNHDFAQLVGKIQVLDEREVDGFSGIYFETKMADTELGNDTLKNYIGGVYDNHSIGFQYIWEKMQAVEINTPKWDEMLTWLQNPKDLAGKQRVYICKEIKLWEGSTVAFGANMLTPFLGMKSGMQKDTTLLELDNRLKKFENVLRNGTQTDDMMMQIEAQALQLKQFISDLMDNVEFKDLKKGIEPEPTIEGKGIDYSFLRENLRK